MARGATTWLASLLNVTWVTQRFLGEEEVPGAVSLRNNGTGFEFEISNHSASLAFRSLSAFVITDTELKLIAAAAIIGLNSRPK